LILAWSIYSTENNETLVLNGGDTSPTSTQPHLWAYGGNHGDPATLTNKLYLTGVNFALFARSLPSEKIYKCPADFSTWPSWNSAATRVTDVRSYAMNCYMGTAGAVVQPISLSSTFKVYTKASQFGVDQPANRFVFMDVNPANICTPSRAALMKCPRYALKGRQQDSGALRTPNSSIRGVMQRHLFVSSPKARPRVAKATA